MSAETSKEVALVTGGTRGMGAVVARRLAGQGYHVVITARQAPADCDVLPAGVAFLPCDMRKADAVGALVTEVERRHGRIDLVVNNAGGSPEATAAEASPRFHEAIIALNLVGPLHLAQAAFRVMRHQRTGGLIVNIASISGVRPSPGTAAYGAAKAGLLSLTRTLAMEWAPLVRVNALVVGLAETEAAHDHYGGAEGIARIAETIPMGRMAHGGDVAEAVLFLASPAAAYITGAEIALHGGGERPPFLALAQR